jgi:Protein of unknown function (DUF819)
MFVPLAVPLLLLDADLQKCFKSTGTLLKAFLIGSVGTFVGTVVAYMLGKCFNAAHSIVDIFLLRALKPCRDYKILNNSSHERHRWVPEDSCSPVRETCEIANLNLILDYHLLFYKYLNVFYCTFIRLGEL